jgi:succinate---hydroxymethylglutarate CoA-transferase
VQYRIPPPFLGEHTEEVLRDVLGYGPEEIRRLREEKAI